MEEDDLRKFFKRQYIKNCYTLDEIAEIWKIKKDTVRRKLKQFEVPVDYITGSPLIYRENLIDVLIKANVKKSNKDDSFFNTL